MLPTPDSFVLPTQFALFALSCIQRRRASGTRACSWSQRCAPSLSKNRVFGAPCLLYSSFSVPSLSRRMKWKQKQGFRCVCMCINQKTFFEKYFKILVFRQNLAKTVFFLWRLIPKEMWKVCFCGFATKENPEPVCTLHRGFDFWIFFFWFVCFILWCSPCAEILFEGEFDKLLNTIPTEIGALWGISKRFYRYFFVILLTNLIFVDFFHIYATSPKSVNCLQMANWN